jgi:lysozyme family protein
MFDKAVNHVIEQEGGYVNHKDDPGGETKYGISKRQYPDLNIKDITKETAKNIYKTDYWDKIRGDLLPYPVALSLFDISVNIGNRRAVKMLQKVVEQKDDGILGDKTLKAISGFSPEFIAERLCIERINYYAGLSTFRTFGKGWVRRSIEILTASLGRH